MGRRQDGADVWSTVEVFGDLKPGNEIANRGTDELKAGASVQVKQAKPASRGST
jgi:hypothetical protein